MGECDRWHNDILIKEKCEVWPIHCQNRWGHVEQSLKVTSTQPKQHTVPYFSSELSQNIQRQKQFYGILKSLQLCNRRTKCALRMYTMISEVIHVMTVLHFLISTGRLLFTFILQNEKCRIYWLIFLGFVNLYCTCIQSLCLTLNVLSSLYENPPKGRSFIYFPHYYLILLDMFLLHVLFHFNLKHVCSVWQNCVF